MNLLTVFVFLTLTLVQSAAGAQCQRRVCYAPNWGQYGSTPETKFLMDDIDPSICTHIIYAFAKLDGNKLASTEYNDLSTNGNIGGYEKATNLKKKNPNLKVMIAVGGWSLGSDPFHHIVDTPGSRTEFVSNAIQFLRAHKFDGLDLDWEFPADRGSPPDDKHKFSLLIAQLREAFNKEASGSNRLLLSAALTNSKGTIDSAYEVAAISQNLDWINLMTYDFHGNWDTKTGHNSPLYHGAQETGSAAQSNIEWTANYFVQQGAPKDKIVIGLGFYAHTFTLTTSANGIGAPATPGASGPYTKEAGTLSYYEICELYAKGAAYHFLQDQKVPYLTIGNQWAGYDDPSSLKEKVKFVRSNGYGGTMAWSLNLDDFKGHFCGKGTYPLANAVKDACTAA